MPDQTTSISLNDITPEHILATAARILQDRAKQRDAPQGERSMARAVDTFNCLFGQDLTETQGWQFMQILKISRSANGQLNLDDYVDGSAYSALAAESAIRDLLAHTTAHPTKATEEVEPDVAA